MLYRAITVRQPWATLLACGVKGFETRSWPTRWRGPLAIHASARLDPNDRVWCLEDPGIGALIARCGYRDVTELPLGAVLSVGRLVDCLPTEDVLVLTWTERALGDWRRGRWAWRFAQVERLPAPVPTRGSLGLWPVELDFDPEPARR